MGPVRCGAAVQELLSAGQPGASQASSKPGSASSWPGGGNGAGVTQTMSLGFRSRGHLVLLLGPLITVSYQSEPSHWSLKSQEQARLSVVLVSAFRSQVRCGSVWRTGFGPVC